MIIGQAARASGVSTKMIRHYEQSGLIPAVGRTASGYRDYSEDDVHVLRFIRGAPDVSFQVAEIRKPLDLWTSHEHQSTDVKRIALAHIAELRLKIQEQEQMASALEDLVSNCAGNERPSCPILEGLETHDPDEFTANQEQNARFLPRPRTKRKTR